ncbi:MULTISPECIES: hypothetical protein [Streptacidiphilus]|uniref:Uncharacterized protein n=2 Tax=Streptacidiphilus TaxID=228398 RepID=A0ABV6UK85_9ACTN|nr:hypothetical protein [Streptacidiphilus jeojiense]
MNPDEFDILWDPRSADTERGDRPVLDLPPESDAVDAADALEAFFVDDTEATTVEVTVADAVLGTSSRDHLLAIGSPGLRTLGDADGATLPGESLRYRILRFECDTCHAVIRRIHVDRRSMPQCPNGHDRMRLVP